METLIKNCINIENDNIFDWLQKYVNEERFERLSYNEMPTCYDSKINTPYTIEQADLENDESDIDDSLRAKEKVQASQVMKAVNVFLNFCEQEHFDFHEVINIRKIKSEVRKTISNRKK